MKIQTGNEFLDQVVTILTRRHNYTIQSDLLDGGLNAMELKGYHALLGEHLILWNLDNEDVLQYIIAQPRTLAEKEEDILKSDVSNLVNAVMDQVIDTIKI